MKQSYKQWVLQIICNSICLFLLLFAASGQHTEAAVQNGTCGNNAKWEYDESSKTFTISGEGAVTLKRRADESIVALDVEISPKKMIVKEGITSITFYNTNHPFQYNEFHLDQVSLPDSLQSIQGPLFMNCKIAALTIPRKVKELDAIPFLYANIKELKVHKQNKHFTVSKEGILFSKNRKTLLYYPRNCKMKKYEVPKSVTKIGQMAFYGNDSLENIVFTKKIKTIGNGAFAYCHHLKKTNIQITKVKQIQDYNGKTYGLQRFFGVWYRGWKMAAAPNSKDILTSNMCGYYDSDKGKNVYSDNMNYFGTFQGSVLSSFIMPNSMKYMGKQTFYPDYNEDLIPENYKQKALKKLFIGKNFRGEINDGKSGSNRRTRTLDLYFAGWKEERGGDHSFQMKTIQVHKQNKKYRVKSQVLYSRKMDTIYLATTGIASHLTVDSKVHYIAKGAFYGNQCLKSVRFKGAIFQIHDGAFESCYKLKKLELPGDGVVERVGKSAFYSCGKLTFIAGKIRYMDDSAFANINNLNFDTSKLTYIGNRALEGLKKNSIRIDGPLEYIGKQAISSSTALKEISIHSTKALVIDDYVFSYCALDTVSLTSDVSVTLGKQIFYDSVFHKVILSKGTVIPEGEFRVNIYGVKIEPETVWV